MPRAPRIPRQRDAWRTRADIAFVDEPVQATHLAVRVRRERHGLVADAAGADRVSCGSDRRRDLRRRAAGHVSLTIARRRRPTPRHAGLREQLQQLGWPELEHFRTRVRRIVRRARLLAGARVDPYASMHLAHANRRNTRDVPGADGLRTFGVRQIARRAADVDTFQSRRLTIRRLDEFPMRADRIDDAEKQRRGRFHADESGIAGAVEVADPHDQHVRAEDARRPRVAETPRRAGLPRRRSVAAMLCESIVGARRAPQHLERHEARLFGKQARAGLMRFVGEVAQRRQSTAIREHRVQRCSFFRRHLAAAERERETVVAFARELRDAGDLQKFVQTRLRELCRQRHRGNVA